MLAYITQHPGEVAQLVDLLDIFAVPTRVNFDFLRHYLSETIPKTFTMEDKREVNSFQLHPAHIEASCCKSVVILSSLRHFASVAIWSLTLRDAVQLTPRDAAVGLKECQHRCKLGYKRNF